jgi:uncharacterized Zn-binding protein involved in type VI secretion
MRTTGVGFIEEIQRIRMIRVGPATVDGGVGIVGIARMETDGRPRMRTDRSSIGNSRQCW